LAAAAIDSAGQRVEDLAEPVEHLLLTLAYALGLETEEPMRAVANPGARSAAPYRPSGARFGPLAADCVVSCPRALTAREWRG
jgi:hypothetical protein